MENKSSFNRFAMLWLCVLVLTALFAASFTPAAAKSVISTRVPATAGWVNTHIQLSAGQRVIIQTQGTVTTLKGSPKSKSGPNGQKNTVCPIDPSKPQCAMNNARYGVLVGKIGFGGTPFIVGKKLAFTAETSGTLYLAVNDNLPWYGDNAGTFRIKVRLPLTSPAALPN